MAGDWLPITVDLLRRREVGLLATALDLSRYEVVGRLVDFWGWAGGETEDGFIRSYTVATLSAATALPCSFFERLIVEEWLVVDDQGATIPNWERWFSDAAKARLGNAIRQQIYRKKQKKKKAKSIGDNVATNPLPKKRREENSLPKGKEKSAAEIEIPEALQTDAFTTAWAEWIAERRTRRLACTPRALNGQLRKLAALGAEGAISELQEAIANGWQSVCYRKENHGPQTPTGRPVVKPIPDRTWRPPQAKREAAADTREDAPPAEGISGG